MELNPADPLASANVLLPAAALAGCAPLQNDYTCAEEKFLLELARNALVSATMGGPQPSLCALSPKLAETRACFVTLTCDGELRGCVGQVFARAPLQEAVIQSVRKAAQEDPRFSPVQAQDLEHIRIEISVLTTPELLVFASPEELLTKVQPLRDGIFIRLGEHAATFLPQVWAQIPDRRQFFEHLCIKAGCMPDAWREPGTLVYTYQTRSFEESAPLSVP